VDLFFEYIDKQLESSDRKNLFYSGDSGGLDFIDETRHIIGEFKSIDTAGDEFLVEYTTDRVLSKFCQSNQYYSFDKNARDNLKKIYRNLIMEIRNLNGYGNEKILKGLARKHHENLAGWLRCYNSFAEKLYPSEQQTIEPVACSEYSAELQVKIFRLDITKIFEPVLDIGCGSNGLLVKLLREKGFEAYGFDRFAPECCYFEKADWLDFRFEKQKWGTITSNLGFSNHFKHHHLRIGSDYIRYARKYIEILESLKTGGSFFYAPTLPFIEPYLDSGIFRIEKTETGIQDYETVKVTRLK